MGLLKLLMVLAFVWVVVAGINTANKRNDRCESFCIGNGWDGGFSISRTCECFTRVCSEMIEYEDTNFGNCTQKTKKYTMYESVG
jgi:hypothetical protein